MKVNLQKNVLTFVLDDDELQSLDFTNWFNEHKGNCSIKRCEQ